MYRVLQKAEHFQGLCGLGAQPDVSCEVLSSATKFVAAMYGNPQATSLNNVRTVKASAIKQGKVPPGKKLPPTDDSFKLHVMRANFQMHIWRQSIVGVQEEHDPIKAGYERASDGPLQPKMMCQNAASPELMNGLVCTCMDSKCQEGCPCYGNGQPCTAACSCEAIPLDVDGCTNPLLADDYQGDEN